MFSRASLCLSCKLKVVPTFYETQFTATAALLSRPSLSWHTQYQTRSVMHQARQKPSRMQLSAKVGRSPARRVESPRLQTRRKQDSFAHLNRTKAPRVAKAPSTPTSKGQRDSAGRDSKSGIKQSKKAKESENKHLEGFKALKMQRALGTVSYGQRSAIKNRMDSISTFRDFPLLESIQEAIESGVFKDLEDLTPSPVQKVAIPSLLAKEEAKKTRKEGKAPKGPRTFLIAAETGSGKTLAYLLPAVDAMKRAEVTERETAAKEEEERVRKQHDKERKSAFEVAPPELSTKRNPSQGRPRIIVLVPTAELVDQVQRVAKDLCHTVKFRVAGISRHNTATVIRNKLFRGDGIDVVISTPHLLSSIAESDPNILSKVSHLIVDEADSLLDRSFLPTTSLIIAKATPSMKQMVFCSATIPRSMDSYISKYYPDMERIVTPRLHSVSRRVQLNVVDVSQGSFHGNKMLACASTIYDRGKSTMEHNENDPERLVDHIIVFVNERETATEVATYLQSKGIMALAVNRDTKSDRETDWIDSFKSRERLTVISDAQTTPPSSLMETYNARSTNRSLPHTKVLVTTDLGSRGIDTLSCRLVVLYDIPHSTVDFIHRLGRVGRMNRRGQAIALVGKGDRRDVVKEVREAMYKGQALI